MMEKKKTATKKEISIEGKVVTEKNNRVTVVSTFNYIDDAMEYYKAVQKIEDKINK